MSVSTQPNGRQSSRQLVAKANLPQLPSHGDVPANVNEILAQLQPTALCPDKWTQVVSELGGGAKYREVIRCIQED